ncbi:MAG: DUF3575 domain-containing protein [Bacteroidaceae bacterium]|nr:DUF3575 domain-containing protein [Bacteroidaceae bacterium]
MNKEKNIKKYLLSILAAFALWLVDTSATAQVVPDSLFLKNSRPIIFKVNKTKVQRRDSIWITDTLFPLLNSIGPSGVLVGRSAASPEGPYNNNVRLAKGRRDAAFRYLKKMGFDVSRIIFKAVPEDYVLLKYMMKEANDPDYLTVRKIIDENDGKPAVIKQLLKKLDGGKLWKRVLKVYYPELRAVRIMAADTNERHVPSLFDHYEEFPVPTPPTMKIDYNIGQEKVEEENQYDDKYRREMLSVKTNLLEWAAYIPGYGQCPLPNVSIEYYPRHGHFSLGASFDCPWWIGNTTNHKYFELRNYTVEGRYYLRNSDLSYVDHKAAFKGLYFSAYGNTFLYQIGFNANKGWIGEGVGAGAGLGYVMPLGRKQHWRVEFGATFGFFWTKYDPFVYGCPVEKIEDGLYYYNYTGDADLFKKRQHRFMWLGPTRVGVSITYDLLYRKRKEVRNEY